MSWTQIHSRSRVVLVAAVEEVRRRAGRARSGASRRCRRGSGSGAARGPRGGSPPRGRDQLGVLVEHALHVRVLAPHGRPRRARAASVAATSAASRRRSASCSASCSSSKSRTIITSVASAACPSIEVRVDEAVPAVGRLGRERVPRERGDEVGGELDGVDELPLREARVHAHAGEPHDRLERREGLVLDLAGRRAVEGERGGGAERLEVEELRAVARPPRRA